MNTCIHDWKKDECNYYCEICGQFSKIKPNEYVEESIEENSDNDDVIESCRHNWECLRDRCHNRGSGKYQAYKCTLCKKFQRR